MEYYLTTYSKDYKWPVRHSPVKEMKEAEIREKLVQEQTISQPCSTYQPQHVEDPQIDPAQCGAPPAGPESKFGQPLTYLRKLYLKYPYLYQILKLTPPEELAKTVYGDKFVSTYSADYKVEGFAPMKGWLMTGEKGPDEAVKSGIQWTEPPKDVEVATPPPDDKAVKFVDASKTHGDLPCGCVETVKTQAKKIDLPTKRIAKKPCAISKIPRAPRDTGPKKKEESKKAPMRSGGQQGTRMGKWKSEYRDTISKMGAIIIQKKLLSRVPPEMRTTIDK